MSGRQNIFNLPYPRMATKGLTNDMLVFLDRNLLEIERQLSFTQLYQEDTVKEVIDSSGNLKTDKLDDKTVGLEHALQIANQAVTTAKIALKAVTEALLADGAVTNLKLAAGAVTEAKTNWQTHLLSDYAIADNTPQVGYVSWSNVKIVYKGEEYTVTNGSSNKLYLWWDLDYPDIMQAADTLPAITDDDVLIFLNKNGTHLVVPKATVVDGSLLVSESVLTDALAANAVTAIKIAAGAVQTAALAAGAVTAENISVENLAAISANLGVVNAGFINVGDRVLDITDMATAHDGQVQNDANVTAYFPFDDSLYDSKNLVQGTFSRDSVAYLPNGLQVASGIARYDTARIVRGAMIEEGTTNLLTNGDCESDVPKLNSQISYARCTGALDTAQKHSGSKSFKITNQVGVPDIHVQIGDASMNGLTAGQSYTLSAWIYVPSGLGITLSSIKLTAYYYNGAYTQVSGDSPMVYDTWVRVAVTVSIPVGATQAFFRLYFNQQIAESIYWDDIQLENKPYATSFINSTRAAETLTISTAGVFQKGNWAVELTFKTNDMIITNSYNSILFDCYIDANNRYVLFINRVNGKLTGYIFSAGVGYIIEDANALEPNTLYSVLFSGNGSVVRLCKNGTQVGIDLPYIEPAGNLPALMQIGGRWDNNNGSQANGIIDELRFSKVARTLLEHQAYYNSNKGYTDIEPIIRAGLMVNGFMVTPEGGAKCYHSNGSFSQMSWEGFRRYVAGEGKDYHYLTEVGRASTVGAGYRAYDADPPDNVKFTGESQYLIYVQPITIQLPNDYKGKNFQVFAELRMNGKNLDTYYRRVVLAMAVGSVLDILWVCEVYDHDYINATFKIKAYSYMYGHESNKASRWYEIVDGVDISYTVTA